MNQEMIPYLNEIGANIGTEDQIFVVKDGELHHYDGNWHNVIVLMHFMQRVANPLITLTNEDEINDFLDTSKKEIWKEDYEGGLLAKSATKFDSLYVMNVYLREFGFNTRVVAFFSDKDEYRDEIKILKFYATVLANRYNLRIGIVTDQNLVKLMKKWRPDFFF